LDKGRFKIYEEIKKDTRPPFLMRVYFLWREKSTPIELSTRASSNPDGTQIKNPSKSPFKKGRL